MSGALRVLLVEDSEDDALLVIETIRANGWDVRARRVEDEQALRAALTEPWDLVISDFAIPGFGGDAALRILQETGLDIPFIVVSGTIGEKAAVAMMRAGAKDYILKGDLVWLAPAIERELHEAEERREKRRAKEKLAEVEARSRAIFEQSGVGLTMTDLDGVYVQVNRHFGEILGYAPEELVGKRFSEITHPDDLSSDLSALPNLKAGRVDAYRTTKRYLHRAGHVIWVRLTVSPVRGPNGAVTHLSTSVEDITAQKLAEERIRLQAHLLDCVEHAVIATDLDGTIVYWNRFATAMYGWTADEAIGRSIFDIGPGQGSPAEARQIFESLRQRESWSGEFLVRNRDGNTFPAYVVDSPILDESGALVGIVGTSWDIAREKAAQGALEASERRYRLLFERNLAGVYQTGLDGTILDCNDGFAAILGCSGRDSVRSRNMYEFFPTREHRDRILRLLETRGMITNLETELRRADGRPVWILENISLVDDGSGSSHLEGTIIDITDRKRVEHELRDSEQRYRSLFESARDIVSTLSWDGRILSANPAFERVTGWPVSDWIGRPFAELLHPDDAGEAMEALHVIRGGAVPWPLVVRITRRSGEIVWVECTATVVSSEGGEHIIVFARNVTRRKEDEDERRRIANYLQLLLESTGDGVVALDIEGRCELVNESACRILGHESEEIVGRVFHDVTHRPPAGSEGSEHECPILATLQDAQERRGDDETFWRGDDRPVEIEYCASPIIERDVTKGVIVTFRDVTERHQLENQLERMKRLDSLGKLAGTMAHEFNNVMMAIMPFAELLLRRAGDDMTVLKAATHILDAIQRGKVITSEILRFTRPTLVTLRPVDLVEMFEKLAQQAPSLVGRRHQVEVSMPVEPLWISGDAEQLTQVVVNLLINARDAMPGGGMIRLSLERCSAGSEEEGRPASARIVVQDSGTGIPDDVLPHIFEPMFTTKRNGTGLGLFLVHQVVRRHAGEIAVESPHGQGARFSVTIPIAQAPVNADS